jgi:hypothetical protein
MGLETVQNTKTDHQYLETHQQVVTVAKKQENLDSWLKSTLQHMCKNHRFQNLRVAANEIFLRSKPPMVLKRGGADKQLLTNYVTPRCTVTPITPTSAEELWAAQGYNHLSPMKPTGLNLRISPKKTKSENIS